jgi:hypothetical protein
MHNDSDLLNSASSFYNSATDSALALEHGLIMLLLLAGMLSIRGQQRRYVPWVVLAGVLLSLLTPTHAFEPAWPFISALVLPPLLWQIGLNLATARPSFSQRGGLAWLLTGLIIAAGLRGAGQLPLASSLLLGMLSASLMWQVRERVAGSTDLGAFGQLSVALLLAEISVTENAVGPFLGTLFSGAGGGLVLGFIGVRVAFRLPAGEPRNLFCLGLAYIAYLLAAMIGTSGVVAATSVALMVGIYGYSVGLWPTAAALPEPLCRREVFTALIATWMLMGWQAHVPMTVSHAAEIGLGTLGAFIGLIIGRRVYPVSEGASYALPRALLRKEQKVFLLLSGTLLLWPQEAELATRPLLVALLAALVTVTLLRVIIYPVFEMLGIELRLPDQTAVKSNQNEKRE